MRFERTQQFLEIYTANPEQVSCLTLYTEEGDKVQGRALIWVLEDGSKFMDRIYAYENDDYTLRPESPAFKLGFKPIDLSRVGLRGIKDK